MSQKIKAIRKSSFLLIFTLLSIGLKSQNDFFEIIHEINKSQMLVEGIESIKEFNYSTFKIDTVDFDTLILVNNKEVGLYFQDYSITEYHSPTEFTTTTYGRKGDLISKSLRILRENGQIHSEIIDMQDSPLALIMNSIKTLEYDASNRLISVKKEGLTGEKKGGMEIIYGINGLPKEMKMDLGFGEIQTQQILIGDTIRYELELKMDDNSELSKLLGDSGENKPKQFIDVVYNTDCNCHYFINWKENEKEGGSRVFEAIVKRDKKGNVISKAKFLKDGTKLSHHEYTYNKDGTLLKTTNIRSNMILKNEYHLNGKVKVDFNEYYKTEYEYDSNWNVTKEKTFTAEGEHLTKVTLKEIKYQ